MPPPLERNPLLGYWGKPTSTLDWCEENYVSSYYIAEFWNTITNLMMILPGFYGMVYFAAKGFEIQYIVSMLSLFIVGLGSWMFHMTLQFEMQLLDELPMLYTTCVFLYTLSHRSQAHNYVGKSYIAVLVLLSMIVTFTYLIVNDPILHQVFFGILVLVVIYEATRALKTYPIIRHPIRVTLTSYIISFTLWNIDNHFCPYIRSARNMLPPGVGVVTQLHGWWHLLVGYGTYVHILFGAQVRALHFKQKCVMLNFLGIFPYHLEIQNIPDTAPLNKKDNKNTNE